MVYLLLVLVAVLVLVVLLQLVQDLADGLWQKIASNCHVAGLGPVLQKICRAAELLAGLAQKVQIVTKGLFSFPCIKEVTARSVAGH